MWENRKLLSIICIEMFQKERSLVIAQTPPTLPAVNPEELAMTYGFIDNSGYEDTWYVPHQFYMLTKVKLWTDGSNSSGFEVTFSAFPQSEFIGWPDITHVFGETHFTSNLETVTLNSEIFQLSVC